MSYHRRANGDLLPSVDDNCDGVNKKLCVMSLGNLVIV